MTSSTRLQEWEVDDPAIWFHVSSGSHQYMQEDPCFVVRVTARRIRVRMKYPVGGEHNEERVVTPERLERPRCTCGGVRMHDQSCPRRRPQPWDTK